METNNLGVGGASESSPNPQSQRRLHTIKDVCEKARISPATAWRLIGRDALQVVRIGRRTLVTDESLSRLIAQGAR